MEQNSNGGEGESHSVMTEEELVQLQWRRETVPRVLTFVSSKLPQRDLVSLLLVSPWLYRTLSFNPPLWQVLSRSLCCSQFSRNLFDDLAVRMACFVIVLLSRFLIFTR